MSWDTREDRVSWDTREDRVEATREAMRNAAVQDNPTGVAFWIGSAIVLTLQDIADGLHGLRDLAARRDPAYDERMETH